MVHQIYMCDYTKGIYRKFARVQQIANELDFEKSVSKDTVLKEEKNRKKRFVQIR